MSVAGGLHTVRIRSRLLIAGSIAVALVFATMTVAAADPVDQTVSFTSSPPTPAVYGGSYVPTATADSGLDVTISLDAGSSGCTLDSGTVTFAGVGTCKLKATQGGNSDFNPASATQQFTIDPADLTVPVFAVQTYGDSSTIYLPDKDNFTGLQFDDQPTVLTGTLTCMSSVSPTSPVGQYQITSCSGPTAPNYTVHLDPGFVTVKPAPLTITASGGTFIYGHSVPTITASYSGFKNSETSAVLTTQPTCATTATSSSNVGSYPSSCSGAAANNYQMNYGTGVVNVTRASLIVTASSGSFQYGGAVPPVTASYSGFQGSDGPASLSALPTCTTAATSHSSVGSYPTSCSGAASSNYTFAYQNGTMAVNKATLIVTASSPSVGFGDDIPVITPVYSGFVNGDDQFDLTAQPTCTTTATSTSPAGPYPTSCSGGSAANYTINYVDGTLTVVRAILVVTASSATIPYGSAPPAITPFYDGFLNGDDASDLATQPTCGTAVTSATQVGTYMSTCSGGVSSNYTFSYTHGTITVKKKALMVTANDVSRPMGGANAFTYSFSGFVNGDGPSAVSGSPAFSTGADAASEPGMYLITISAGTLSATNYSFTFINGWLTVTKGTPHIVAAPASKAAALKNHKMTFSATATNNLSGLPIAGVTLKFSIKVGLATLTCSGVTNSAGTATCTNADGRLLLVPVGQTYTVTFAGNFDYLPGSGTGTITA